jgi:hypothetical protein
MYQMLLPKVEIILEKMNCSILNNLWRPSNIRKQLNRKVINTFYGPPHREYILWAPVKNV